ncbi:amidohydrolase family protein [Deinococcus alpinitundrae]|uniref:amidohydrolase family protein n=1 Tax=Deinococcus alpinitundrae TaxID=468913 RepID=UPI0013798F41|nr:amidohydrolase family protein [Deinococcus alpinitundrae]
MTASADPVSPWLTEVFDAHAHFPVGWQPGALDLSPLGQPPLYSDHGQFGAWYGQRFGQAKFDQINARNAELQKEWWRGYSFPFPGADGNDPAEVARRWSAELDRHHVGGILWVTGGGNERLAQVCAADARFHGLAHHEPGHPQAGPELRRAVTELGLSGYKMFATSLRQRIDDRQFYPLWQAAEDLQVPVLIHFGILGGAGGVGNGPSIDPLTLHDVAKGFPDVTFIVPHFGCGYVREALQLAWACPNVVVDTSGNNEWTRWMDQRLSLEDLYRRFYETIGPERIVFGTDSASFPRGLARQYVEDQLRAAWSVGIKGGELKQLFAGNIKRLLKMAR